MTAFGALLLFLAFAGGQAEAITTFSQFSSAFQNTSISEIRLDAPVMQYPCFSTLSRAGVSLSIVSSASTILEPSSSSGECPLTLKMKGMPSALLLNLRFSGDVSVSLTEIGHGMISNSSFSGSSKGRSLAIGEKCSISINATEFGPATDGCLSVSSFSSVSIENSVFLHCSAADGGGAILANGSRIFLTLLDSALSLSLAGPKGYGGALRMVHLNDSIVRVERSNFTDCGAGFGGCIAGSSLLNATVDLVSLRVQCVAQPALSTAGGGLYFGRIAGSAFHLESVELCRCGASDFGGGVAIRDVFDGTTFSVRKSRFYDLGLVSSPRLGGAVSASNFFGGSALALENVTVSRCAAVVGGGAVHAVLFDNSSLLLLSGTFTDLGTPYYGGAVMLDAFSAGSAVLLDRVLLSRSEASFFGAGIAASSFSASAMRISGSIFSFIGQNSPPVSGGMLFCSSWSDNSRLAIDSGTTVSDCDARQSGSGIHAETFSSGASVTVQNSSFTSLGAPYRGGMMFVSDWTAGCSLDLQEVTVLHSEAGGRGAGLCLTRLDGVEVLINSSSFSALGRHSAPQTGGFLSADAISGRSTLSLVSLQISNSEAMSSGAGVFLWNFTDFSTVNILSTDFFNVGTATTPLQGGAVSLLGWSSGCSLLMDGVVVYNALASDAGAGVLFEELSAASIVITNSYFSTIGNSIPPQYGAAIYGLFLSDRSSVEISSVYVYNCDASHSGGAIYMERVTDSTVAVASSTFELLDQSTTPLYGGVMYAYNFSRSSLSFASSTVSKTEATYSAAGLVVVQFSDTRIDISAIVFSDIGRTWTPRYGCAFQANIFSSGTVRIRDVSISHADASYAGGGIHLQSFTNSVFELSNSSMSHVGFLAAPQNGGGLYAAMFTDSSIILRNVSISYCDAFNSGSGLMFTSFVNSSVAILRSAFSKMGLYAIPQYGGAIALNSWSAGSSFLIDSVLIEEANAAFAGGGISVFTVRNCSLEMRHLRIQKMAPNLSLQNGGGICLNDVKATCMLIQDSLFSDIGNLTSAAYGGAISLRSVEQSSSLKLVGVRFEHCEAGVSGAGVDVEQFLSSSLSLENCTFSAMGQRVTPIMGGVIRLDEIFGSTIALSGVAIRDSDSSHSGSGISVNILSGSELAIRNSTFARLGLAGTCLSGGAIAATSLVRNSVLAIRNSTFENNFASVSGGHLFFQYASEDVCVVLDDLHFVMGAAPITANGFDLFASNFADGASLSVTRSEFRCTVGLDGWNSVVLESSDAATAILSSNKMIGMVTRVWLGTVEVEACRFSEAGTIVTISGCNSVVLRNLELVGQKSLSLQSVGKVFIANFMVSEQSTATRGACLSLTAVGELEVVNSTFRDSVQTVACIGCGGGALAVTQVAGRFENVQFSNLSAAGSGGAIMVGAQSNIVFSNCSFLDCHSQMNGGAIDSQGANITVKRSRFENCRSTNGDGGSISGYSSAIYLSNVVATAVSADKGGFLAADGCPLIDLRNVTAHDCSASTVGGALSFQAVSRISMEHVVTTGTNAKSGGSMSFENFKSSSSCFGTGLQLANSSASDIGGCIQMTSSGCNLENSVLTNCSSPASGGGAHLLSLSALSGTNLTIQQSSSSNGGGVYASGGSSLNLHQSVIKSNFASLDGGGILLSGAALSGNCSQFAANAASSHGGTIFATESATVSLSGSIMVAGKADRNGGGVYFSVDSVGSFEAMLFRQCIAGAAGGVLYIASDRRASHMTVSGSEFDGNSASTLGGAIALIDPQSSLVFSACAFRGNSAGTGGAVYFDTLEMPAGLNESTHSGNKAVYQGGFCASGPVKLSISPERFDVESSKTFSVTVRLLDYFDGVVHAADATCVRISSAELKVLGGSGSFEGGKATLPSLMLVSSPGATGTVVAQVEAYNLSATIPFSLRNCSIGEISTGQECIQCSFGTYSKSDSAHSCSPCPDGAVCVNGSQVVPKWGYWRMPGSVGVCSADQSCSLPKCAVEDVCFGASTLWLDAASHRQVSSVHSFEVTSGYSSSVAQAASFGAEVLLLQTYWVHFVALNCSGGACRLFLESQSAWPTSGAATVESLLFVPRKCSSGYRGNLCSECRVGFAKTSGVECGACEGALATFLLSLAFALVAALIISILTWLTLRNAGKKGSQVVSIAKVAWSYTQLMAGCAALPMGWPSAIMSLFRVQDTASSVNSRQLVSLDCLLFRLGVSDSASVLLHSVLLMIIVVLLAALFWSCFGCCRHRSDSSLLSGVGKMDKFFVTIITALFLMYPKLSSNSFALFPCKELSTDESFMSFDLATSCSSGSYTLAVAFGVAGVLVYAFGIPVLSFFLVWRKRKLLHTTYARNSVGFLFLGYTSNCYFFESVVMLKKMLFGGIVLMSAWLGAEVSATLALMLFSGAYFLHIELKPFDDESTDRLERLSSFALLLCVSCGLLFSQNVSSTAQLVLIALLLIVNGLFFCCAAFLALSSLRRGSPTMGSSADAKSKKGLEMRTEMMNPLSSL